jgi:hypothetical protein
MIYTGITLAVVRLCMAFQLLVLTGHWLAGFTAMAHVYMGILLHCWWVNRVKFSYVRGQFHSDDHKNPLVLIEWMSNQPWQWGLFCFMNVVEIFSFAYSRGLFCNV